jgi:hypothetical protein
MENENILVKLDHNNLIHIDPNSVINNGVISERNIKQENLVIYVNLEVDLIPRTKLIVDKTDNITIASGTLSLTQNNDNNTSWTDTYVNNEKTDTTNQSFGISDITITNLGYNSIPKITINFIDVRGKTLFENPKNSPYKAFFHLPWPIYYLTIKGFYGKAIRYKLHLEKFNSKYNESNGNFEINTSFIGSTYAFMGQIGLRDIMTAPYLFGSENVTTVKIVNGETKKVVTKTSRGLNLLKSIFNEYKKKGLIDNDVPVKTVRELGKLSESLDNYIDNKEFTDIVDPIILTSITALDNLFNEYEGYIRSWKNNNLTNNGATDLGYKFNNENEKNINLITDNNKDSLNHILTTFNDYIKDILKYDKSLKTSKIKPITLKNNFKSIDKYYVDNYVAYDRFLADFNLNRDSFINEKLRVEKNFEEELNKTNVYKKVFGFKPTLRNLFGILMANADVLLRLLKDTHEKAFEVADERKKLIGNYSNESYGENIYPWPEISKTDTKANTKIITYPADRSLITKLKSDNKRLWPEVAFIEEFIAVSTNVYDNNNQKENGVNNLNYNVNNDDEFNFNAISQLTSDNINFTYLNKTPKQLLYEIWERIYYLTTFDYFEQPLINLILIDEFNNLFESIKNNRELVDLLKSIKDLDTYNKTMFNLSQHDDFAYKRDLLPITDYIKNAINKPFTLIYDKNKKNDVYQDNTDFNKELRKVKVKDYRKNIYPFSSEKYKTYLESKNYGDNELKIYNNIERNNKDKFLFSPIKPLAWVKDKFRYNIFKSDNENILNTSFFHYQLYSDFINNKNYVGSSYLLLTTLPFLDLDDKINFSKDNPILMSTLLKEYSMQHKIPYFLILKWGAIYHRYKKKILSNIDILEPILQDEKIKEIDNNKLFDNNQNYNLNIENKQINFSNKNNIGIHPYYDAIFSQIINGYTHFNLNNLSSYDENIKNGIIKKREFNLDNLTLWTNIIDNKIINSNDNYVTILPSIGLNGVFILEEYNTLNNSDYRIFIAESKFNNNTVGKKLPTHSQYFKSVTNEVNIDLDYKNIYDLIATFNYKVLDEFETLFLSFANGSSNNELEINSFQKLLKNIVTIKNNESSIELLFNKLSSLQLSNIANISKKITSEEYLMDLNLFNSKDINPFIIKTYLENKKYFKNFYANQINQTNLNLLKLYVGECPNDINYYLKFFEFSNIELNENNIKELKLIILLFGSLYNNNKNITNEFFDEYVNTNLSDNSLFVYSMNNFIAKFKKLDYNDILDEKINIIDGYNNKPLKIEMYNHFKTFNDQWIGGNSLGQRLLMEDCLFLDKANREIGDRIYLNISRFKDLLDEKNINLNLYSSLSFLIQGTGFDIRALPAYLNFYNNKENNFSNMLFGTYLEVDYEDTTPKLIFQYTDVNSKYPSDMTDDGNFLYNNDSFDMNEIHGNPLIITDMKNLQYDKSNRVVSFEVNIGDSNQNMFKSVSLDQSSFKNTTESHRVTDYIARSNSGANSFNIDSSLYNIYRLHSYTCSVTCIGNVMIQPTMYFYLNNIPMFRGSYLITEVTHTIKDNNMVTNFKGVRISNKALPSPEDSFMSSYKSLFDRIIKNNVIKQ